MKCPYQKKVIHKPEFIDGFQTTRYAEDIIEFCDCLEKSCPFYYERDSYKTNGKPFKIIECRRVESEVLI